MTKTFLFIRSPESYGRPEEGIANAFIKPLQEELKKLSIKMLSFTPPKNRGPINGVGVYGPIGAYLDLLSEFLEFNLTPEVEGIYLMDAGMPIMPMIDYIWHMSFPGVRFPKTFGLLHSTPQIKSDILNGSKLQKTIEEPLISSMKRVFVASEYLRRTVSYPASTKAYSLGALPYKDINLMSNNPVHKSIPIISSRGENCLSFAWNHRVSEDKGWSRAKEFLNGINSYSRTHLTVYSPNPLSDSVFEGANFDYSVIVTRSRREYIQALTPNAIYLSFAELETFGYSMLEAVVKGGIPLTVDHPVYKAMYNSVFLDKKTLSRNPVEVVTLLEEYLHNRYECGKGSSFLKGEVISAIKNCPQEHAKIIADDMKE